MARRRRRRASPAAKAEAGPPAARSTTQALHRLLSSVGGRPVRRENGRERPLGPKAARTRAAVLKAAHDVFCERGYQASSVAQIAAAAGVSMGTFYQYFRNRGDVLGTLVAEWVVSQLSDPSAPRWEAGRGGLRRSIRAFVAHYASTVRFQAVWAEVTQLDPGLAELRRELLRVYVRIVEREIRLGREAGRLRTDLDPAQAAQAVIAMIDRHCWVTYVFDPAPGGPPSVEETTDLLTELVAGALRFEGGGES